MQTSRLPNHLQRFPAPRSYTQSRIRAGITMKTMAAGYTDDSLWPIFSFFVFR
jgi:hypothetical protein